jgi:hypothetical protein
LRKVRASGRRFARRLHLFTEPPPATELIAAACKGDTRQVERLLQAGAAADARDPRGRTALHAAASRGHADAAACLLAYGASHMLVDHRGRTALGPESISVEELHAVLARGEGRKRHYDEEEHWWAGDEAYVTNNAFKYSPDLARFCCTESLLHAATLHVGERAYIQRGLIMRYLPSRSSEDDMFRWHHYEMFLTNRYDLDYCRRHVPHMEIYDALGEAGDVFLFDSNGAHRGVRRETGRVPSRAYRCPATTPSIG